jgi:hypothetical protein
MLKKKAAIEKRKRELELRGRLEDDLASVSSETSAADRYTADFIFSYFKTLWLSQKGINTMDSGLRRFKNLVELSLTGNVIDKVENVPSNIEILHLNANL